jgi:hypothetical protein
VNRGHLRTGHAVLDADIVRRQLENPDVTVAVGLQFGNGSGKLSSRHVGGF